MPIYEYRCPECGHEFEKLVRLSARPPGCPECDHDEVKKMVSAASFSLKGGGWYKDHYGLKGSSGGSSGSDSSGSDGGSASSSSSGGDS